ncbi:LLM class flavin-dependent oxidoreductase [Microbacterium trichothecenolyticum]|uniref:LLM class flavin-dependent oxidoreductase n=1 Tax=Microbacterium trichothecenolyticum TaxID=69370 RepID=UPI0027E24CEF|nr:LLM class flavin-dependent oxidoreductase [Microbacterium trichothecenolyticum]
MSTSRQLHFGVSAGGSGLHRAAWRRPDSDVHAFPGVEPLKRLAQIAEAGKFDTFFLADGVALDVGTLPYAPPFGSLEPLVLLSAISQVTERIGLIGTASTTFSQPYTLARQLSTLDHVSGGRAGWNIVTSSAGAENYGDEPLPDHLSRYRRAAEFAEVVTGLWNGWDPDAVSADRENGLFADPAKVHPLDHRGEFYQVKGPLNVPRSPQGRPVLVQAGSSSDGQAVGAKVADAIFTAQSESAPAREFYAAIKGQARAYGRNPDHLLILPGLVPVVGDTETSAWELQEELDALIDIEHGRRVLGAQLGGADLSELDLDRPIPEELLPHPDLIEGRRSRYAIYRELAVERKWPLRRLISRELSGNGHWHVVGSPEQVADALIGRFDERGADGFNVIPPFSPLSLELFVEHVIPILQRRGYFRTEYEGTTLREHFDLPAIPALSVPSGSVPVGA